MSGGSMDYIWAKVEEASDMVSDKEISELLKDLSNLLYDETCYNNGACGEEDYLKTLVWFKQKWFGGNREERLKKYVDEEVDKTKNKLYSLIGVERDKEGEQE